MRAFSEIKYIIIERSQQTDFICLSAEIKLPAGYCIGASLVIAQKVFNAKSVYFNWKKCERRFTVLSLLLSSLLIVHLRLKIEVLKN